MVKTYDYMVTLFRKQYCDPEDPSKGFSEVDYFTDPEVGFFPLIGNKYLSLAYSDDGEVVPLDTTPVEWKVTQRNSVEYAAVGLDKPDRSLKPIALEHAHIFIQFRCEIETGACLRFLQESFGHKKFKLIACKGTSEQANDYTRAIGSFGGIDNPERKNADGLPSSGGTRGVMSNHEPKRSRQGKQDDAVAEIHQYIVDHALDHNLDMFVFFSFSSLLTKKLTKFLSRPHISPGPPSTSPLDELDSRSETLGSDDTPPESMPVSQSMAMAADGLSALSQQLQSRDRRHSYPRLRDGAWDDATWSPIRRSDLHVTTESEKSPGVRIPDAGCPCCPGPVCGGDQPNGWDGHSDCPFESPRCPDAPARRADSPHCGNSFSERLLSEGNLDILPPRPYGGKTLSM